MACFLPKSSICEKQGKKVKSGKVELYLACKLEKKKKKNNHQRAT